MSPTIGTFRTLAQSPDETSEITDINFSEIESAHTIKQLFMTADKEQAFNVFDRVSLQNNNLIYDYDLALHNFHKDLMYPATLINIMSKFNNLQIDDYKINEESGIYKSYASYQITSYLFTIIDTICIKALFLIYDKKVLYLSPLNIRNARNSVRKSLFKSTKTSILDDKKFIEKNNRDLRKKYRIDLQINSIDIDANEYDIIIITQSFDTFQSNPNNIGVRLNNFDLKTNHKSSILKNNSNYLVGNNINHIISLNKCNNYTILNTTWKPFNIYNIEFIPGSEKFYYINNNTNNLVEVTEDEIISDNLDFYHADFYVQKTSYYSLANLHFFTCKSKHMIGGYAAIEHSKTIPEVSLCSDIHFPHNFHAFCWFSSIINGLFFADDISTVFLNKCLRNMDKTLEYIKEFYYKNYKTFSIDIDHLKECNIHLIYLFTFIYSSFSVLSKNQLNRVRNKKKWYDIYNKIVNEYYLYVYVFIIVLSKVVPK